MSWHLAIVVLLFRKFLLDLGYVTVFHGLGGSVSHGVWVGVLWVCDEVETILFLGQ